MQKLELTPEAEGAVHNALRPSWAEAWAAVYLMLPVFLFFALYVAWWIAVPACALLGWAMVSLVRRAGRPVADGLNFPIVFMALVWVLLCGELGGIAQTGDWLKHYAVLNQLAQHGLQAENGEVLRYSVAWYMVPSLVLKTTGFKWALGWWTLPGVILLFRMLVDLAGATPRALLVPAVFTIFGGFDILGWVFTGHHMGPPLHYEWWSRWIEYAAQMTSLAWVPQHALAGWLVVVILLLQLKRLTLRSQLGVLLASTLLWSPFIAIGLLPFALLLVRRETVRDWRNWVGLLLAVPLVLYLTSGTGGIPANFAWQGGCEPANLCPTPGTWARFVAIEFLVPSAIVLAWRRDRATVVAVAVLLLIPLYRYGALNDFGMRSSIPALAVVAIAAGLLLVAQPGLRYTVPLCAALAFGSVTGALDMTQRFVDAHTPPPMALTLQELFKIQPGVDRQYLARPPGWLLR